jgi:predicted PhzF superfamily epimerase YddE/YHI9
VPYADYLVIDAFTEQAFSGNPAAVVLLEEAAETRWMQQVAAEFNLAETAFVRHAHDAEGPAWTIRWMTPTTEVALCGHATLASAAALWRRGLAVPDQPIRFLSASGALVARQELGRIVLDFPALPCAPGGAPHGLAQSLGASIAAAGANGMDLLVELADAASVAALTPDLAALARLPVRGVIVTAAADAGSGCDLVSRFFAPAAGIPEDPVTGSAHCALLPWWAPRLGREDLVCRQLSPRGGTVFGRLRGERVDLGGHAVVVAEGRLLGAG